MRINLKIFRIKHNLTQEQMATIIGCMRSTYSCIESGKRDGRPLFWKSLQNAFNLAEGEINDLKIVQ